MPEAVLSSCSVNCTTTLSPSGLRFAMDIVSSDFWRLDCLAVETSDC
jgi:hypothetical protein